MSDVSNFEAFISGDDTTEVVVHPFIAFNDVMKVERSNKGIIFREPSITTINTSIYSFRRKSIWVFTVTPEDEYLLEEFQVVNDTFEYQQFMIGPTVTTGHIYVISVGTYEARYTALGGDDSNDVRDGLISAINGGSWPATTISAIAPGTGKILVQINDPAYEFTADIIFGTKYLFQTGLYCQLDAGIGTYDYLISVSSSYTDYPSVPALDPSYDFGDLILCPAGLAGYLNTAGYTQQVFATTLEGTADITNFTGTSSVTPGECVYDDSLQRLIFHPDDALDAGEWIRLLFKS